jgi:flagellin-specific chaperone FliS
MTLADVKSRLRVDFNDHDTLITSLMNAAIARATSVIGELDLATNHEAHEAVLDDIEAMYRGDGGSLSSMKTYRRLSIRPMI